MNKQILITGGAGFIGSHLVDRLLADGGWAITVVDDLNDFYSPEIKRSNLGLGVGNPNFEFVEIDIRDAQKLGGVFDGRQFDCIVHLAARAGVRPSLKEPKLYAETNINGTLNLLELARDHDAIAGGVARMARRERQRGDRRVGRGHHLVVVRAHDLLTGGDVHEAPRGRGDDDLVAGRHLVDVVERLTVRGAVAGDGGVAWLPRQRRDTALQRRDAAPMRVVVVRPGPEP